MQEEEEEEEEEEQQQHQPQQKRDDLMQTLPIQLTITVASKTNKIEHDNGCVTLLFLWCELVRG